MLMKEKEQNGTKEKVPKGKMATLDGVLDHSLNLIHFSISSLAITRDI